MTCLYLCILYLLIIKMLSFRISCCLLIFMVLAVQMISCASLRQIKKSRKAAGKIDDIFTNAYILKTGELMDLSLGSRYVKLINVPDVMQSTDYTCGPASLLAVLNYYQFFDWRESDLAKIAKTDSQYGTRPQNIMATLQQLKISAELRENMTIPELQSFLNNKTPVIVQIQAWADEGTDYKDSWKDGHYVVAIGYDTQYLYFQDPWILGNIGYIKKTQFLDRWHDIIHGERKVYNLGIIVHAGQKVNPVIVKLE